MSRLPVFGCALALVVCSAKVMAQDSPSPRHVLASCMMKRMAADRMVSYLEAQRVCRNEGKGGDAKPQTAANAQTKPVS